MAMGCIQQMQVCLRLLREHPLHREARAALRVAREVDERVAALADLLDEHERAALDLDELRPLARPAAPARHARPPRPRRTSAHINSYCPAEETPALTPGAISLLRRSHHSGRIFNSAVSRVVGPFAVPQRPEDAPFVKYTLFAFELRR